MSVSTTAAAIVLRTSHSHVSLTALELDFGRHHLLALQTAVAAKVGGEEKIVENVLLLKLKKYSLPQVKSPHQTTPTTTRMTFRGPTRYKLSRD